MKVVLENLTKIFPSRNKKSGEEVVAVNDFTFEIPDGKLVGLLGPSGCGKSTTLYMISGLQKPSGGKIFFGEDDVTNLSPENRGVGLVFQNYALYPHMTVADNMSFALRLRGVAKEEISRRVSAAAETLGLAPYLKRLPKALSGGQRQRVALGRAIVREPAVFLFDEPLSNLDAKMRVEMRAEIIRLHNRLGATMIYVTHDQTEAMTMGERIVVMNEGRVQQVAKPLELYERPANEFVAGFIGTPPMNLFPPGVLAPGTVGLRPEHIALGEDDGGMSAQIDFVESLGSESLVHVDFRGVLVTVRIPGFSSLRAGGKVRLIPDMEKAVVFS
jgi:ABC-type sugar transport system ATPase subunit